MHHLTQLVANIPEFADFGAPSQEQNFALLVVLAGAKLETRKELERLDADTLSSLAGVGLLPDQIDLLFRRTQTGPYAHLPKEQPAGELEDAASLFEKWSAVSTEKLESSLEQLHAQLAQERQEGRRRF